MGVQDDIKEEEEDSNGDNGCMVVEKHLVWLMESPVDLMFFGENSWVSPNHISPGVK